MFPVFLYEDGMDLPTEGTYYVVAGNGTFLRKQNGVVDALVPVQSVSCLDDLNDSLRASWKPPKLPASSVQAIQLFFKEVVAQHRSESCTLLYFNKKTNEYHVEASEQKVNYTQVQYKLVPQTHKTDFLLVGTIHSHCDFMAGHSGTDHDDEEFFDGLHCTFGHNDKKEFSISASVVVNGYRIKVDPMTVLEGIERVHDSFYRFVDQNVTPEIQNLIDEWLGKVFRGGR